MTIPLKQVIQAIEEASEVFTSFWDAKTGKTVYLADPLMVDMAGLLRSMRRRKSFSGTTLLPPPISETRRNPESA